VTFRRLRQSLRFSFDQDEFEKQISMLRDKNTDLESLRTQVGAFTARALPHYRDESQKIMPHYYCEVQAISTEAHRALISNFSCSNLDHDEHTALVALDIGYEQGLKLNMAISYIRKYQKYCTQRR
jgi:hypothetical protein